MEWLQVETTLPDHRKIARLASELKLSRVHAVGLVVCFWLWAVHNREDGILEDIDTDTIARVTDFKGKPEKLVSALCSCGLLDRLDSGYVIHDWEERVGLLIDKRNQQREQTRDRVQKYRARKKQESETACNDNVTRYSNEDVTRYSNADETQNGNARNADVTHPQYSTVQYSNKDDDDEDEDDRFSARAREKGCREIACAIKRCFNREANPVECDAIYKIFRIATDIPLEAVSFAIELAARNGANNLVHYLLKVADEWKQYPIKSYEGAAYINSLLLALLGKDPNMDPVRASELLQSAKKGEIVL